MFCDECGSMLKKENGAMKCTSCGREKNSPEDEMVSVQEQTDDELIETVEDAGFEGKPTDDNVKCDECGNGVAWYTIKQTGSADEPPTRFFKCTECDNRWRDYS